MSEDTKDFVIKDRRIFSGEEPDSKPESTEETETVAEQEQDGGPDAESETSKKPTQLPEINFATFVFSLNASALVQLGVMEDPASGKKEMNLPLAKQTIDILSMLQEKTAGNLTDDEGSLLKNILYDLRIRYVKEKG